MSKLLIVCCVLFLAMAASADQLLYVIDNFAGSTTNTIAGVDVTSWSNLKVVGTGDRNTGTFKAYYWDPTLGSTPRQMLGLPGYDNTIGLAMSSDGSVIVGTSASLDSGNTQVAVRFYSDGVTNATRLDNLGVTHAATVGGISADGTTAIGYVNTGAVTAVKWNVSSSTVTALAGPKFRAYNTDEDATFIVGRQNANPYGWVSRSGTYYTLANVSGTTAVQEPRAVTSDGQYVFGNQTSGTKKVGVVWKWNGSAYVVDTVMPDMEGYTGDIQVVPGNNQNQIADLAGKYVTGYVKHADSSFSPFIYDRIANKMYDLNNFLSAAALAQIPAGFVIDSGWGISNDGTAITGVLYNATTAESKTFVAMVPEPATIALLGLGGLALIRRKR